MEMEQKQCWMWEKKKKNLVGSDCFQANTNDRPSYDDSWEEQAFAKDAGDLGGSVWPPRSYSCSFCKREFRSAQALGGHMNVHRRDRARLKHESLQIPAKNAPFTPLIGDLRRPSQLVHDLVCNPNPNPKSSSCWLSATAAQNLEDSDRKAKRNHESQELVFHKWYQSSNLPGNDIGEETHRSEQKPERANSTDGKRKRTDAPSVAFFFRSSAMAEHYVSPSSVDDLDLELRLGGRPKPKLK